MDSDRFQRGQATLSSIHGHIGEGVMKALGDIAPEFARFIIEFPYGDIYARGILSPRERQIATISSLVTLGHSPKELRAHIQGGLNVGCSRQDIVEVIMQMAVYAGFPAAVNALLVAKEVFAELDERGQQAAETGRP
ncbi:carboxymuconolactone decarboxylase family protein [Azohydromonas lata]|uniref:Carboxymuconolactone decarboxylase family protein n=1 Tax=Azohydromonas lata TaxID=45677 RepID=A0ABU5ID83_9BURK|nr:carboxymuconolactone decarboxylase family protein [Azohydromonas lata]MDZ5457079.1 carboxymuconolactone decarboxylase family protein [Azohydromonas lata]